MCLTQIQGDIFPVNFSFSNNLFYDECGQREFYHKHETEYWLELPFITRNVKCKVIDLLDECLQLFMYKIWNFKIEC